MRRVAGRRRRIDGLGPMNEWVLHAASNLKNGDLIHARKKSDVRECVDCEINSDLTKVSLATLRCDLLVQAAADSGPIASSRSTLRKHPDFLKDIRVRHGTELRFFEKVPCSEHVGDSRSLRKPYRVLGQVLLRAPTCRSLRAGSHFVRRWLRLDVTQTSTKRPASDKAT